MILFTDGLLFIFFFFFSSRRRHTRWTGDWSSDVCSSDLVGAGLRDTVNPPWASTSRVPPAIVGAGEVTTVRGRLFGSVFGARRPGDAIFRYVADFAV